MGQVWLAIGTPSRCLIPRLLLGFRDLCYLATKSGSLSCLVAPYNASFRQFDQRSLDQYLFRLLSKTICIVENYSNINAKAQITRQSSSGIRFAIVGPITNEKGFNELNFKHLQINKNYHKY